jgi:eukaryotic-like serine/threonine-protein kinase
MAPDGRHLFTHNSNGTVSALRVTAPAHRAAAEWALSVGGTVRVRVNAEEKDIRGAGELPKEPFALTSVDLRDTPVTDAELVRLTGLAGSTALNLNSTAVTDAGLVHLKNCADLTELRLYGTKTTAKGAAELAAALPKCKILHDGGTIEPKK